MTVTIEQLQQTAQTLNTDAQVRVTGASGESYPIQTLLADGDTLVIRVQDELDDDDSDDDDDDSDE